MVSGHAGQFEEEGTQKKWTYMRVSSLSYPLFFANRRIGTSAIPWLGVCATWLDKRCAVLNPAFGP